MLKQRLDSRATQKAARWISSPPSQPAWLTPSEFCPCAPPSSVRRPPSSPGGAAPRAGNPARARWKGLLSQTVRSFASRHQGDGGRVRNYRRRETVQLCQRNQELVRFDDEGRIRLCVDDPCRAERRRGPLAGAPAIRGDTAQFMQDGPYGSSILFREFGRVFALFAVFRAKVSAPAQGRPRVPSAGEPMLRE